MCMYRFTCDTVRQAFGAKTQSSPSCAVSGMAHIFYTELIVLKSLLPIYLGFTLRN